MGRCRVSGKCTLGMEIVTKENFGVIYHGGRVGCFLGMERCALGDGREENSWVKTDAIL